MAKKTRSHDGPPIDQPDRVLDYLWAGGGYQVPAAWSPDPLLRAELRWWDGESWTPHVSTSEEQHDERVSTPAIPILIPARAEQIGTVVETAYRSSHLAWMNGYVGQAAWHATHAFHMGRVAAPLMTGMGSKGGLGTSVGVGYLFLGPAGLIVGPLANSVRKRYNKRAASSAFANSMGGLAAMMLGATEEVLEHLPRRQTEVQCLYAWQFLLSAGGQCASFDDAMAQVAHTAPSLVHTDLDGATLLYRYSDFFGWSAVLHAFATVGFTLHREDSVTFDEPGLHEARKLLGIDLGASRGDVRRAYHAAAKQWHPDTLGDVPQHVKDLAAERMVAVNEAYALLLRYSSDLRDDSATASPWEPPPPSGQARPSSGPVTGDGGSRDEQCAVDGCQRRVRARGLCSLHLRREGGR